jgi:hypothetical protein
MLSLADKHRVLKHLNYQLIKSLPYLAVSAQNEVYRYDARLNPAEYYAGMPQPRLFEEKDIFARLDAIASEFVVAQVVETINELDKIDALLSKELSSPNHALTRADSLQWEQSQRTAGMTKRQGELGDRLRYLLGLPPMPPMNAGGMLDRS